MATGSIANVMPTSGSNTYGYYIKFPDGTLIQWGSALNTTDGAAVINFPVPFESVSAASMVATPRYLGSYTKGLEVRTATQVHSVNTGYVYFNLWNSGSTTYKTADVYCYWLAIGRWK